MSATPVNELFGSELKAINLGLESFARNLDREGAPAIHVNWRPPAGGDRRAIAALDALEAGATADIDKANAEAARRILASKPTLVGIGMARDVVPGMAPDLVLHAGPPVAWKDMCGPMRGAVIGGLIYEGLAADAAEAEALAGSGKIRFDSCHHHDSVGPMAGIMTAGMPVWIMENKEFGNRAYCTLNEGLGKVLRYGANSREVIDRLRWMRDELAPILSEALALRGSECGRSCTL